MDSVPWGDFDTAVTLCAEEVCPATSPSLIREHWPFPDPAGVRGSEEEILAAFRKTRDDLRQRLEQWIEQMKGRQEQ